MRSATGSPDARARGHDALSGPGRPAGGPGSGLRLGLFLTALVLAAALAPARAGAQAPSSRVDAVDSLAALGRLQEAAWLARDAGDTARAGVLLDRLDAVLRSPPRAAEPLGMDSQGVSYTFHLDHGGGIESIFKVDGSDIFCRTCGADREVASYAVDRLLGLDLTPMTVPTRIVAGNGDTLFGSTMYFIHDAATPGDAGVAKPDRLRFFDAVIGNSDRHPMNWLVIDSARAVAIDHNRAFQFGAATRATTCWEIEIDSIGRPGELGRPFERYRTLSDDSLAAAVAGLDPELVERFIAMRSRVVERVRQRAENPDRPLRHEDCVPTADAG